MEHACGKGKYRQEVFCEELVWIDLPSSIPIPIQEDGASGVLETQLLLTLGMGHKGWRPHPGHPAKLQPGGWGHFPGPFVFLAMEVPGGRATLCPEEPCPAQPPPLTSHPSSVLHCSPFPSTAPQLCYDGINHFPSHPCPNICLSPDCPCLVLTADRLQGRCVGWGAGLGGVGTHWGGDTPGWGHTGVGTHRDGDTRDGDMLGWGHTGMGTCWQ